ncbi:MAG: hypothetical protein HYV63_11465 [Candidatus Schekmanbacteria bacterium]|nr:hypothetical protein [Candidatus Schekmanbacteria bacterium]
MEHASSAPRVATGLIVLGVLAASLTSSARAAENLVFWVDGQALEQGNHQYAPDADLVIHVNLSGGNAVAMATIEVWLDQDGDFQQSDGDLLIKRRSVPDGSPMVDTDGSQDGHIAFGHLRWVGAAGSTLVVIAKDSVSAVSGYLTIAAPAQPMGLSFSGVARFGGAVSEDAVVLARPGQSDPSERFASLALSDGAGNYTAAIPDRFQGMLFEVCVDSAAGFLRTCASLNATTQHTGVDLDLAAAVGEVTGAITMEGGAAVPDGIKLQAHNISDWQQLGWAETGAYRIQTAVDTYTVSVELLSIFPVLLTPADKTVEVGGAGRATADFTLYPANTYISGQVLIRDSESAPYGGAEGILVQVSNSVVGWGMGRSSAAGEPAGFFVAPASSSPAIGVEGYQATVLGSSIPFGYVVEEAPYQNVQPGASDVVFHLTPAAAVPVFDGSAVALLLGAVLLACAAGAAKAARRRW